MTTPATPRGGFTLLELLVVVSIIALLAAIVMGVGPSILGSQKKTLTQATLHGLDGMLDEYTRAQGGSLPAFNVADYAGIPGEDLIEEGDGLLKTVLSASGKGFAEYPTQGDPAYPRFPDAAVFVRAARDEREAARDRDYKQIKRFAEEFARSRRVLK
jgi:prepilin-type N-terminal cleavage/methylation domain-containing protein